MIVPTVVATHSEDIGSFHDIRCQIEARRHDTVLRQADVMPVEPEVSSEAHTFQFNEELPSFNLPNIEMLTVPYDGIAEL